MYKDSQLVSPSLIKSSARQSEDTYSLTLTSLQESDYGNYSCVARNVLGTTSDSLMVTGSPDQPLITGQRQGLFTSSYKLVWTVWTPPGANILNQSILYRRIIKVRPGLLVWTPNSVRWTSSLIMISNDISLYIWLNININDDDKRKSLTDTNWYRMSSQHSCNILCYCIYRMLILAGSEEHQAGHQHLLLVQPGAHLGHGHLQRPHQQLQHAPHSAGDWQPVRGQAESHEQTRLELPLTAFLVHHRQWVLWGNKPVHQHRDDGDKLNKYLTLPSPPALNTCTTRKRGHSLDRYGLI